MAATCTREEPGEGAAVAIGSAAGFVTGVTSVFVGGFSDRTLGIVARTGARLGDDWLSGEELSAESIGTIADCVASAEGLLVRLTGFPGAGLEPPAVDPGVSPEELAEG